MGCGGGVVVEALRVKSFWNIYSFFWMQENREGIGSIVRRGRQSLSSLYGWNSIRRCDVE